MQFREVFFHFIVDHMHFASCDDSNEVALLALFKYNFIKRKLPFLEYKGQRTQEFNGKLLENFEFA